MVMEQGDGVTPDATAPTGRNVIVYVAASCTGSHRLKYPRRCWATCGATSLKIIRIPRLSWHRFNENSFKIPKGSHSTGDPSVDGPRPRGVTQSFERRPRNGLPLRKRPPSPLSDANMSPKEFAQMIRRIEKLPDNLLRRVIIAATHEELKRIQKNIRSVPNRWQKG